MGNIENLRTLCNCDYCGQVFVDESYLHQCFEKADYLESGKTSAYYEICKNCKNNPKCLEYLKERNMFL